MMDRHSVKRWLMSGLSCLFIAFMLVGALHEVIPGLHTEDEAAGETACPFCKVTYTPILGLAVFVPSLPSPQRVPAEDTYTRPRAFFHGAHRQSRAPPAASPFC